MSLSSSDKNRPVLVLYLRVRVYVERIDMIQCQVALHHYYLQLRENLLDQWSGSNSVREERCWELATLAVQADEAEYGTPSQFRAEKYFPLWVINLRGLDYVRKNMPKIVKNPEFQVSSAREAKMQFCQEASRSPFALNCHLYGLRRHKADMTDNALIGINDKGIDMWDVGSNGERIPLRSLPWNKMVRLTFDHKKLTIGGVDNSKMSLFAQSDDKARYILNFCKDVHQQLIQINLHFALSKKPYNSLPPGWGNEVCVDSGRINRLAALPPIQAPSPQSQSTSTTPAQSSPASAIISLPPYARGSSPHPLMRIHQQHSIDSTTTAAETPLDSEKNSVKERTGSDTSSSMTTTNITTELPKKKRSSGGAKARIATNNLPPSTKIGGRYEPHQPNQKHNRISPTYSNASDNTADSGGTTSSIPNEIENFLNNAASPPRYKPSDEEIAPNGIMTNSTSSTMSGLSQKLNGTVAAVQQQQQQQYDTSGYASSQQQQQQQQHPITPESAAERRNHFVASRTFDEYPTSIGNATMEAASRSLHDLRFQQHHHQQQQQQQQQQFHQQQAPPPPQQPSMPNGYPAIRQPPNYHFALQQLTHHQQPPPQQPPPSSHRTYPMPQPPPTMNPTTMTPPGHPRPSRWPTVNGADPDLMLLIERMHLQHQQFVPTQYNIHPSQQQQMTPRKQNSMTIEQQQDHFGVHRGVSEPRLNLSVHQNNQQPQGANLYATNNSSSSVQQQQHRTPLPHQHSTTSNTSSSNIAAAQKKRRYTSRSPSNRGINRVKSMPAPPSGVIMNDANGTRFHHSDANGIPSSSSSNQYNTNRQPPPYNHAFQMQQETNVSRKNALEKRHSTSGIAFEHVNSIHQFPMLNALMQENGGMPSTSASEDTSTTSIISTTQGTIPPQDYDRSSLESDTVSIESGYRQQRDGSFAERYATTPPRPSNLIGIQQQASSISGSPPSPPFYYTAAQATGPLMWNNNNSNNAFSRGEYLIQDNLQSFLASVPHGYRNIGNNNNHGNEIGHRPNGLVFESYPFGNV
uniref:FERM domain-containing protein n=1 Tax=Panagrolaimus superbus TaxID=310955 RepID=A0A914YNT9_9BILA